jgi:CRISPR-associated endonuclease Csn1
VDVFAKSDKRGKTRYYLVPVYPHHIADQAKYLQPPDRAAVADAAEADWTVIDSSYAFLFSLYGNSLIEVAKSDGEIIAGYFKGFHRGTGALSISPQYNPRIVRGGIGAKTLTQFKKLNIDRMGKVTNINKEVRTWHGVACT